MSISLINEVSYKSYLTQIFLELFTQPFTIILYIRRLIRLPFQFNSEFGTTKMKLVLPLLFGLVSSINGLQVEGPITYDLDVGPNGAEVFGGSSGISEGCQGFAELKAQETTLFHISKAPREPEDSKMSKIILDLEVRPVARSNSKTLNVQGNCCWKFYKG